MALFVIAQTPPSLQLARVHGRRAAVREMRVPHWVEMPAGVTEGEKMNKKEWEKNNEKK